MVRWAQARPSSPRFSCDSLPPVSPSAGTVGKSRARAAGKEGEEQREEGKGSTGGFGEGTIISFKALHVQHAPCPGQALEADTKGLCGDTVPFCQPCPPLPTRHSSVVPRPMLPDTLGLVPAPSPPRDGSATTAKAPEPSPPLAQGKMGSPEDPLFPPGALEGLGAEDPGILHPLCSQLVGLKRRSAGRGWEKAARANDESWDRTRGILFSCGAAGRQEAPPAAHGTQPPPARGPTGERWAPDRGTARAPLPAPCPGRCRHHSPYSPGETERGLP